MSTTLTHPADIAEIDTPIADSLLLPHRGVGGGTGERHRSRPASHAHKQPDPYPKPQTPDPKPAPLTRDLLNRLLTLYTTHSNSFNDLCRELDMSMLELLDLLEHPEVTRALERLAQATEARAKTLARLTSDSAVSALIDLLNTTDKPETRRMAAGAILRHGKPPAKSAKRAADESANPSPLGGEDGVAQRRQVRGDQSTGARVDSVTLRSAADLPPPPRGEGGGEGLDALHAPAIRAAGFSPRSPSPKKSQAA